MNDAVRQALRPFADFVRVLDHFGKSDDHPICKARMLDEQVLGPTAGDCRRARQLIDGLATPPGSEDGLLDALVTFCGDWQQANPDQPAGLERDGKLMAALLRSGLIPIRSEIIQAERDACVSAALSARYGAPSNWTSLNPPGWHLDRVCTPTDAIMHDNGTVDAAKAIRAREDAA